ncbi:hypothetical protein POM88_009746 [Heracleum sosnowskyi]|uniref:DUF7769 domain-containing protein n=1 Tax=Heracleum sosnowskyi TaxID=360622 RepID=A0AAD8JB58_9APIA|nr:hypothetical protein POM88_009746 [Heracleum sosnowskyi]
MKNFNFTGEEDELQNELDSSLGEPGRLVPKKLKVLSNEERKEIYLIFLGSKSVTGKLRKGTIRNVSRMFSVSTRTVSRIWRQAKRSTNPGLADVRGANTYKIPHINKGSLEREKKLPIQIQCDAKLIEDATKWLNLPENV